MRMRKSYRPQLVFTKKGNLVAIGTGADATSEHEWGIAPLLNSMTAQQTDDDAVVQALRNGETVVYSDIAESRRIINVPEDYQFVETEFEGEPEAWLGVSSMPFPLNSSEISYSSFTFSSGDPNVACAWCDRSFCVRVRGKKYVKALRGFHEALLAGDVMFAGLHFQRPGPPLSGIILANRKFFSEEDKANLAQAQLEYEKKLRLKARDDSKELLEELTKFSPRLRSMSLYIWVRWADEAESEMRYCVNPPESAPIAYGSYTRQQLIDWAQTNCSYKLGKA